jgi:hypothetical protein
MKQPTGLFVNTAGDIYVIFGKPTERTRKNTCEQQSPVRASGENGNGFDKLNSPRGKCFCRWN